MHLSALATAETLTSINFMAVSMKGQRALAVISWRGPDKGQFISWPGGIVFATIATFTPKPKQQEGRRALDPNQPTVLLIYCCRRTFPKPDEFSSATLGFKIMKPLIGTSQVGKHKTSRFRCTKECTFVTSLLCPLF
jgi:hypothetical protein